MERTYGVGTTMLHARPAAAAAAAEIGNDVIVDVISKRASVMMVAGLKQGSFAIYGVDRSDAVARRL